MGGTDVSLGETRKGLLRGRVLQAGILRVESAEGRRQQEVCSRQREWHVQRPWGEEEGGPTTEQKAAGCGWGMEAGDKKQVWVKEGLAGSSTVWPMHRQGKDLNKRKKANIFRFVPQEDHAGWMGMKSGQDWRCSQ